MIAEITSILQASKMTVSLLKEMKDLIPNSNQKDEISQKILQVEKELALAEASTAKELGYRLCKCTFPPQIMLYNKQRNSEVCPNCDKSISSSFVSGITTV